MSFIRSGESLLATCSRCQATHDDNCDDVLNKRNTTNTCSRRTHRLNKKDLFVFQMTTMKQNVIAVCIALIVALNYTILVAYASPPIDYFIYTSQIGAETHTKRPAQDGGEHQLLPKLATIYQVRPDLATMSSKNTSSISNHASELSAQEIASLQDDKSRELAKRVLALVQNASHTHDNNQIDLEATRYAWLLMEQQARIYMKNRMLLMKPIIEELLAEAEVSQDCNEAVTHWLNELVQLKQWALLMWNSWGNFPPAGLYEGSFTDLGSYRSCMSIDGALTDDITSTSKNANQKPKAQYCMFDFQPLVPTRARFHSIYKRVLAHDSVSSLLTGGDYKLPKGERISSRHVSHEFSSSRFSHATTSPQLPTIAGAAAPQSNASSSLPSSSVMTTTASARQAESNYTLASEALINLALKAQYFYYVKFRIGGCLPAKCSRNDARKLAETGE